MKNKKQMHKELLNELDDLHNLRSILSVLSQDHDDLRKLIEVMKNSTHNYSKKKEAYKQFSKLLKSHAKCEEKAVYEMALKFKDLNMETYEAYQEHEVASFLMKKIDKTSNRDEWMGKVKVLAEAVEHHIIEEENDYLKDLKEKLKHDQELVMVNSFIKRRENFKIQPSADYNGVLKNIGEV